MRKTRAVMSEMNNGGIGRNGQHGALPANSFVRQDHTVMQGRTAREAAVPGCEA